MNEVDNKNGWTLKKAPPKEVNGWTVKQPDKKPERNAATDVVSQEQRALGYEPDASEEFERAAELGTAEATRGLISGATLGISENVPGLKTEENIASQAGHLIGSFLPISKLLGVFGKAATKVASKSPVFQKQLTSLAQLLGVGATGATIEGVESLAKGEIPTAEDLLEHGVQWAALDGALRVTGSLFQFTKGLFQKSKATGVGRTQLLNNIAQELSTEELTNAEAISNKALEILQRPTEEAAGQINLPKQELSKSEQLSKEVLEQQAAQAQQVTPKDLKTRAISQDNTNKLESRINQLSVEYQPVEIRFDKEAEALEKNAVREKIDSVGERATTEEELGQNIQKDIEEQLAKRKEEYRPFYEQSEEAATKLEHELPLVGEEASKKIRKFSRIITKPEGYQNVIKNLETVLNDSGYVVTRNKSGHIKIHSYGKVPVENSIELARRLNEIVDYQAVEPTVKEALRSVVKALKQDIRNGLRQNPDALAAFELAEEAHAKTASKFSTDTIRKLRGQEKAESIAKQIDSPTTLRELKDVLSPEQFLQVEREILERLNNKSHEQSKKLLRETEKYLSDSNKKLAQEIVESKNPNNPNVRKKLIQESVIDDMSNALTTGERPDKTLKLWRTPKGQKLVKEAFHNSPNWPTVRNYLERQSFGDMVQSVLKDGKVDIKKFNNFMKDQATVNNIRSIGGEEAVEFFRHLESEIKKVQENVKLLDRIFKPSDAARGKDLLKKFSAKQKEVPKAVRLAEEALTHQRAVQKESSGVKGSRILKRMVEKDFPIQAKAQQLKELFTETMGLNEKGFMTVFGLMKLGLPHTISSLVGYKMFNKLATNPRVRRAFTNMAKKQYDPLKFILSVGALGEALGEEE